MMEYPVVRIDKNDVTYFNTVDDILGRSVAAGDPLIAFEYIRGLQREGFIRGLAVAKMLFRIRQSWELFRTAGVDDDFENVAQAELGYAPATVNKYVNMWESVFENQDISEETRQLLMGKPIETLLLLTAAAREGSLTDEDWDAIARAPDKNSVRDRIKERRGEQTSSKSARPMSIYFRERSGKMPGTIIVTVEGEQKIVGHLEFGSADDDVIKSVERIINAVHMYEIY